MEAGGQAQALRIEAMDTSCKSCIGGSAKYMHTTTTKGEEDRSGDSPD